MKVWLLTLAAVVATTSAAVARDKVLRTITAETPSAAHVTISNPRGNIVVSPGSGPNVHVVAEVRGRDADDASRVEVQVQHEGDRSSVVVVFPRETNWAHLGLNVDLKVSLPSGAALTAKASMGNVVVHGIAVVEAASSMGNVDIDGAVGPTTGTSSMGNVDVTLGAGAHGPVALTSSMGNVDLTVPPGFQGDYSASTSMGRTRVPESVRGGTPVRLHTGMGNATVHTR